MSVVSVFGLSALKNQKKIVLQLIIKIRNPYNPNTETADIRIFNSRLLNTKKKCVLQLIIQIRKLPTMSAVSVFGLHALKQEKKMRFAADNPNTETADNVGSFRILILGS